MDVRWQPLVPLCWDPPQPPILHAAVAAGVPVLRWPEFRQLSGPDQPGGLAPELLAALRPCHCCQPSCRVDVDGMLVSRMPLEPGATCTLDLDDVCWELPPGAVPCGCGTVACQGPARGFARLTDEERGRRIRTGVAQPFLAARELRLRAPEQIFLGADCGQASYAAARVVLLPAPLEATVSYGGGTAAGPAALLAASGMVELWDEELEQELGPEVHSWPAIRLPPQLPAAVDALRWAAHGPLADGKLLLTLGGEHTVSLGPITAAAALHPGLGVLQLDAHLDLRAAYQGNPYSHACVMRRVVDDLGLPVVAVGIRAFSPEEAALVRTRGYRPWYAHRLDPAGRWIDAVVEQLPPEVYLTLDLDALDGAEMPGTGTPEPGGLHYREVLALLRAVATRRRIVAADLVELAPLAGSSLSEFTAARLAAKIVAYTRRDQEG